MKVSEVFQSTYLKAPDLQSREIELQIERTEMVELDGKDKMVVFFTGKERGLVLNKTNADFIVSLYGDDTVNWAGRSVVLYPTRTSYQGGMVDCIRVKGQVSQVAGADDIPF